MKVKRNLSVYTLLWIIAVLILIFSLFQNFGYAKVINYSGIVRGATQKLVKEELNNEPDNKLILYLDEILDGLQNGSNEYQLIFIEDDYYQSQLTDMRVMWKNIKDEIMLVRSGGDKDDLYQMSQEYFDAANKMVMTVEELSNARFKLSIVIFFIYLVLSGGFFALWYFYKKKQLDKIRYTDDLTGLYNISAFELSLEKIRKSNQEYALIYFDLDDFKYINTIYGYNIGDQILVVIANALKILVDKELCARIGNDNFYVCLEYNDQCVEQLKDFLKKRLKEDISIEIIDETTITIGAYKIDKQDSVHDILDNALLAHKNAKKSGKGCTIWYGQSLLNQLKKENMLIKRMHHALIYEEFKLYLQPKFEIPSLNVFGAEALVRWQKEDGSFYFPDEFIPLFETNGFIHELDFYMLEQSCKFIQTYNLYQNFSISVNFSRITIHHRTFYTDFHNIIKKYQIPNHCIEIEITESAFNELSPTIINMLINLKNEGFSILIDDFGSGYSSLNLLNTLELDEIKIDRIFLSRENGKREQIIGLIVDIAEALNMKVICEGIETEEDMKMLDNLNCKRGQGFYFSKPVPYEEFIQKFSK